MDRFSEPFGDDVEVEDTNPPLSIRESEARLSDMVCHVDILDNCLLSVASVTEDLDDAIFGGAGGTGGGRRQRHWRATRNRE